MTSSTTYPFKDAFFFPSVTYGPNRPLLIDISFLVLGCSPSTFGSNFSFLSLINFTAFSNVIGVHTNGENILLKIGRYGPYVELEESKKRKSVLKSIGVENVTQDIAIELLSLPKKLGTHPETNEDVLADFGPYGPYVKCGKINASMKSDESPLTITLENAVKLIKDRKLKFEPKVLGEHPKTKNEVSIKRGRFGPYVTDGKKNASLKGYVVDEVTLDQAVQLIDEKS